MNVSLRIRPLVLLPLALLAGACDDEFLSACYSCLEADAEKRVPGDKIAKIRLLPEGSTLPDLASEVFYDETCGIDCQQIARFDLPSEVALEEAAKLGAKDPARFEEADVQTQTFANTWTDRGWFALPGDGRALFFQSRMKQDGPWPLTVVLVEGAGEEGSARVYWFAGTM